MPPCALAMTPSIGSYHKWLESAGVSVCCRQLMMMCPPIGYRFPYVLTARNMHTEHGVNGRRSSDLSQPFLTQMYE